MRQRTGGYTGWMGVMDKKAAAVCCRRTTAGEVEVLLVRSSDGERWTFPKGSVEPWEAWAHRTAEREAWEEAGVRGEVDPKRLGLYRHVVRTRKTSAPVDQRVEAFLLVVTDDSGTPEPGRAPQWFAPAAAAAVLRITAPAPHCADDLETILRLGLERFSSRLL